MEGRLHCLISEMQLKDLLSVCVPCCKTELDFNVRGIRVTVHTEPEISMFVQLAPSVTEICGTINQTAA